MVVKNGKSYGDIDEVKKVIRALLLSAKQGLTVTALCNEYTIVTSKAIPYKELGYYSAVDLVKYIPDVARPVHGSDGVMYLKGIPDEKTAHISALVNNQRLCNQNTNLFSSPQTLPQPTRRIVTDFIQARISNLINKYPCGLEISLFENQYLAEYGKCLNPTLQGFTCIRNLLESCCDVKVKSKEGCIIIYPKNQVESEGRHFMLIGNKESNSLDNKVIHESTLISSFNISTKLRQDIFSVLMRSSDGVLASEFLLLFKDHHQKDLDIQALGFNSVIELMSKLSDVVDISRPFPNSDWLLTPMNLLIDERGCLIRRYFQYRKISPDEFDESVEVCVSYIISPSLFWIHLIKKQSELDDLTTNINNFYQSTNMKYSIPRECIAPGQSCVALYNDELWYRAIITKILSAEEVTVFFVDYGDSLNVNISSLRILKNDLIDYPCQAIPAKLHDFNDLKWSKEAVEKFFELCHDQKLLATIVKRNSVLSIKLIDSNHHGIEEEMQTFCPTPTAVKTVPELAEIPHIDLGDPMQKDVKCNEEIECFIPFIKFVRLSGNYAIHIIRHENIPLVVSAEISGLFWNGDILKQMLCRKGIEIKSKILMCKDNKDLFSALIKYSVNGIMDGKSASSCAFFFELHALPKLFSLFKCKYEDAEFVIQNEIQLWSVNGNEYWKTELNSSNSEENDGNLHFKVEILRSKRKQLYRDIMMNRGETRSMEEIKSIDEQISQLDISLIG